jgi:hypothetical protein
MNERKPCCRDAAGMLVLLPVYVACGAAVLAGASLLAVSLAVCWPLGLARDALARLGRGPRR